VGVQQFDKYERHGPYHWNKVFGPWSRVSPRLRGLYIAALGAVKRELRLRGARGLDIGCGEGVMLRLAAEQGAAMTGLDGMAAALAMARKLCASAGHNPALVRGDAQQLPFRDGAFDFVTCLEVIEHLERPESMLKEVRRVLRPGGVVVLSTPVADGPLKDPFHVKEFTPEELREAIAQAGLEMVNLLGLHPRWLDRLYFRATGWRTADKVVRAGIKATTALGCNPYTWTPKQPNSSGILALCTVTFTPQARK